MGSRIGILTLRPFKRDGFINQGPTLLSHESMQLAEGSLVRGLAGLPASDSHGIERGLCCSDFGLQGLG